MRTLIRKTITAIGLFAVVSVSSLASDQDTDPTKPWRLVFRFEGDGAALHDIVELFQKDLTLPKICELGHVKGGRSIVWFHCEVDRNTPAFTLFGKIYLGVTTHNPVDEVVNPDVVMTTELALISCTGKVCRTNHIGPCVPYLVGGNYVCFHSNALGQTGHDCQ